MRCAAISGAHKGGRRCSSRRVCLGCSPREMFGADRSNAARPRSARARWRSVSFMRPSRRLRRRRMCPHRRTKSSRRQPSANKIDRRRSQMESPIELVRRFCAAWSDNVGVAELAAFFTDDAVYHNIPLAPVTGREAIANNIASFLRPGAPGIEGIQFRVINIAANGPVVMTERVDVFKLPAKSFELPVMGTFEVSEGKISAWRDYFDMNQFTSRMG